MTLRLSRIVLPTSVGETLINSTLATVAPSMLTEVPLLT